MVALSGQGGASTGSAAPNAGKQQPSSNDSLVVTVALRQVDAERLAHAVALGGELNVAMLGEASGVKPDAESTTARCSPRRQW